MMISHFSYLEELQGTLGLLQWCVEWYFCYWHHWFWKAFHRTCTLHQPAPFQHTSTVRIVLTFLSGISRTCHQGGTLVELFRILTTTTLAKYKILVPPSLDNHVTKLEHSRQPVFTSLNNKFTLYYRLDRVYYRRRRYIYVSSRGYTSD